MSTTKENTTRLVKHIFTDEEKQAFGEDMANAYAAKNAAQNDLDTVKKQIGARITEADGLITAAVEKIRSGYEMRREACTVFKDFKTNTVTVVRDLTGEIIEERTLTPDEAQQPLFGRDEDPDTDGTEANGDEGEETEEEEGETDPPGEPVELDLVVGKSYNITVQRSKRKRRYPKLTMEKAMTDEQGQTLYYFADQGGKGHSFKHTEIVKVTQCMDTEGDI